MSGLADRDPAACDPFGLQPDQFIQTDAGIAEQPPYVFDENTGYMVFTSLTIEDLTHTMWLPVMDAANKAMKSKPYNYDTKFKKDIPVEAATMFDINKTIMRCLVKNLAMFGHLLRRRFTGNRNGKNQYKRRKYFKKYHFKT